MLNIIREIREHGIERTVEKFSLTLKEYPDKILLKYSQIESPMDRVEVQECRGLILTKDGLNVISYPFMKFFNISESNAVKIDFDKSLCLKKLDGTFINLYYHNGWHVSTTGMAEAEGVVGDDTMTFSELFKNTALISTGLAFDEFTKRLSPDISYFFELTTPYNVVVTNHTTSKITLIGARNNKTLIEYSYDELIDISRDISVPLVEAVSFNDIDDLYSSFDGMPYDEEGYVVLDGRSNRVKIKNPVYVAAHHTKSKTGKHHVMEIIKTNEIDEYTSVFTERADEVNYLANAMQSLITKLESVWNSRLIHMAFGEDKQSKKEFAILNDSVTKDEKLERFRGLYFSLSNGKVMSIRDYIIDMDNKELYELLIDGFSV